MMTDRIVQTAERSVVEEGRLDSRIAKRRCPEFITVGGITADLFQAKILVRVRAIEYDIAFSDAESRSDLRHANDVHPEIAEHLVGGPAHGVTLHASALAEEDERPFLLRFGHSLRIPASKAVNGRIGKDEREFEFGNRLTEHVEIDQAAGGDGGE